MKALIIGNGSIGKRHHKNLINLGINVRAIDIDEINNLRRFLIKNKSFSE